MNPEMVVGLFSALFGTVYTVAAWNLPDAAIGNPMAPKYFPLVVGILSIIFSVMLLLKASKNKSFVKKKKSADPGYWVLIAGLIASCLIYALILERIGFLIATPLFLGSMLFLVNGLGGWKMNVLVSVLFSSGVWYIFEKIFMITLP